jgi:hypothetical protein
MLFRACCLCCFLRRAAVRAGFFERALPIESRELDALPGGTALDAMPPCLSRTVVSDNGEQMNR